MAVFPRQPIAFDLLTNARDSFERAVHLIALGENGTEHGRLKHAILSAAHCIELMLKERLRRVHPAFVWEKVDQYPSLDARTVTVEMAIRRLQSVAGVLTSTSDEQTLRSLRLTRNAIEHYEWHTSEKEAKIIVGKGIEFRTRVR